MLYSDMLKQLHNWIMKEPVLSYESYWSSLKLIYLDDMTYKDWSSSWFTFMHKSGLVIM